MTLDDDITLSLSDFGEAGTLDGRAITVLRDANPGADLVGAAMRVVDTNPTALCLHSAASSADRGKLLVLGAGTWRVRAVLPPEHGLRRLELEAAA